MRVLGLALCGAAGGLAVGFFGWAALAVVLVGYTGGFLLGTAA